jgi:hypothetical protein
VIRNISNTNNDVKIKETDLGASHLMVLIQKFVKAIDYEMLV